MDEEERPRLDTLLVERGLARSRGEALSLILGGRVRVEDQVSDKPGRRLPAEVRLEVDYPPHRYVSRGGQKLEKALDAFGLDVSDLTCLDVGASTGGFTDCLLSRGARRVYAVDVGYGLLAWSLRSDPRVVTLDRTNARYLTRETFREAVEKRLDPAPRGVTSSEAATLGRSGETTGFLWPTLATCDVSFISLLKVVPAVRAILAPPWQMIVLVKPQFEAGREKVGSKGVVRDASVHVAVLERVIAGLTAGKAGAGEGVEPPVVAGLTFSPLRGPEGNVEYLLRLVSSGERGLATGPGPARPVSDVVAEAFARL
jgi:23S rRNA (cytidine1920-2'-O)/16S rRNA (cytidine1409-2'-O)-methyltransferase